MIKILDQQEYYLLVSDGVHHTVVERRAGKFYPLCDRSRHGVALDEAGFAEIIREGGDHSLVEAQRLLAEVATRWRDLSEHLW